MTDTWNRFLNLQTKGTALVYFNCRPTLNHPVPGSATVKIFKEPNRFTTMRNTLSIPKTTHSIPKEELHTVQFCKHEVLRDQADRQWRLYNLQRALILGNTEHNHANITFETEEGERKKVQATIWCVSEKYVMLKGGKFIPINAIIEVEY